jgi:transcriptional regulator with XRE-family HTH domain
MSLAWVVGWASERWTRKRIAKLRATVARIGQQSTRDTERQKLFPREERRLRSYLALTLVLTRLHPRLADQLQPLRAHLERLVEQYIPETRLDEFRRRTRADVRKALARLAREKPRRQGGEPPPRRRAPAVEHLEFKEDQLFQRLARALVQRRKLLDLSQLELAEAAGVSPSFLCEIEGGHANPTWDVLTRLCAALDLTLTELLLAATLPRERLSAPQRRALDLLCGLLAQPSAALFDHAGPPKRRRGEGRRP